MNATFGKYLKGSSFFFWITSPGHLGFQVHQLAACGVAQGQIQEHCADHLDSSVIGSHKSSVVFDSHPRGHAPADEAR